MVHNWNWCIQPTACQVLAGNISYFIYFYKLIAYSNDHHCQALISNKGSVWAIYQRCLDQFNSQNYADKLKICITSESMPHDQGDLSAFLYDQIAHIWWYVLHLEFIAYITSLQFICLQMGVAQEICPKCFPSLTMPASYFLFPHCTYYEFLYVDLYLSYLNIET